MADPSRSDSLSGLTASEAQAFHKLFMGSFIMFTIIAIVAHFLVWMWRPWILASNDFSSLEEGVRLAGTYLSAFIG